MIICVYHFESWRISGDILQWGWCEADAGVSQPPVAVPASHWSAEEDAGLWLVEAGMSGNHQLLPAEAALCPLLILTVRGEHWG